MRAEVRTLLSGHTKADCIRRAKQLELYAYSRVWTAEEDAILMENYSSMESDVALLLPGRTPKTCIARANYLNLHVKQRWTTKEDNILKENYPQMGSDSASLLPGRTRDACNRRARKLGNHGHQKRMLFYANIIPFWVRMWLLYCPDEKARHAA